MIVHMVMFKFGPDTTSEQLDSCVNRALDLKNHIEGIVDLVAGRDFSGRNQGFQVGATLRFENRDALAKYTVHPKHQEFVQYTVDIGRQDIIVVDFEG